MFNERQTHCPHHINKLHLLCLSHSLAVLNFKMLPIHLSYCQDFSSTIIELLFPINLKKTSISHQKYKVRVPQLLGELPPFYFWMKKTKKSSLWIVKWTFLVNIWRDSKYYSYTWLFNLWTFCPLWHIVWWWDLSFNFSIIMQSMISNNERAVVSLLTGKSAHEATLAHLQRFLNECHFPCICLGLFKPFHPCQGVIKGLQRPDSRK